METVHKRYVILRRSEYVLMLFIVVKLYFTISQSFKNNNPLAGQHWPNAGFFHLFPMKLELPQRTHNNNNRN